MKFSGNYQKTWFDNHKKYNLKRKTTQNQEDNALLGREHGGFLAKLKLVLYLPALSQL